MFLLFETPVCVSPSRHTREGRYALVCLDRSGACRGDDGRRRRRRVSPRRTPQPDALLADKEAATSVDVELVLAVDVSYSMDMDELAIQREGYAQAIISKEFLQALKTGPTARLR